MSRAKRLGHSSVRLRVRGGRDVEVIFPNHQTVLIKKR
jgi:hypothetical protein